MNSLRTSISVLGILLALGGCSERGDQAADDPTSEAPAVASVSTSADATSALLVVAPDRGYMGNEETRAAFNGIQHSGKQLVFITDAESRKYLDDAVAELAGIWTSLTVLPLFISDRHPGWQQASHWLNDGVCAESLECRFSAPFGASYLAVDALDEALGGIEAPTGKQIVLMGYGADTADTAAEMAEGWRRLAVWAGEGKGFEAIHPMVWADDVDRGQQSEQLKTLASKANTEVLAFHLGKQLDGMMSFNANLRHALRGADVKLNIAPIEPALMTMWMQRELNRSQIIDVDDVGVVLHAHGSDFHWNERMRGAVESLQDDYTLEFAFSMADRVSIESALTRLEQRGVKGAVIVRVFGRTDSFQSTIEKMVGMDVEAGVLPDPHAGHIGHSGMDMGGRIRTPLITTSFGGLDAHPLFAEALLDRAKQISKDPSKETIVLVAHGTGSDRSNDIWVENLARLANHMRNIGGDQFRSIEYGTWREDWPDKRDIWVERIRGYVAKAGEDGGTALVIPARTNAQGPEDKFLKGLKYVHGEGFAPHPLFAKWVESQVQLGVEALARKPEVAVEGVSEHSDHSGHFADLGR